MRILVTNDDGIHAPGLAALERIARALSDDVTVVAPETDQSGVSHSLTLSDPLRLREVSAGRFAVKGTPTDCVIMGVKVVLDGKAPDLVLSGVNRGQNVADDVTYSGTVAGAIEGAILGVRSIAVSQAYTANDRGSVRYGTAEALAPPLLKKLAGLDLPRGTLLNVNFPALAPEEVKGVRVTVQGTRNQEFLQVERRVDGRGFPYFWVGFARRPFEPKDGTDLMALRDGYVSVTPLQLDLTDHASTRLVAAGLS
jgi:5'-nucleotidase